MVFGGRRGNSKACYDIPVSTFRAAVIQAAPVVFNRDATIEKIRTLAADAATQGAKLAVFPEAFVSAYPKGLDFGARVGGRTAEGRVMFRRYFESAIDVPGPAVDAIGEIAREHAMYIVIGVIERDGGTLYCTALFFDAQGRMAGKHRKLMPTAMERLVWGMGDGSTMPVLRYAFGENRRRNLLGKLHAAAADGDVCQRNPVVLRPDRGRSRYLGAFHAAHRF